MQIRTSLLYNIAYDRLDKCVSLCKKRQLEWMGKSMEQIRLNKYLSQQGICSRREADRRIEAGEVTVDGRIATMGEKITGKEQICYCGKPVKGPDGKTFPEPVLLVVYKPCGVVCTASHKDRAPNVVDMVGYSTRIYPVGRLDKDSEGLLLMTNQGDLANKIIHAGNLHEKEYLVTVDRPFTKNFIRNMEQGVELKDLGERTRPCTVEPWGERTFRIVRTQGLNRQIRRMCETLGFSVVSLKRVRIMNIGLGKLKPGDYRTATPEELNLLWESLKQDKSTSETKDFHK